MLWIIVIFIIVVYLFLTPQKIFSKVPPLLSPHFYSATCYSRFMASLASRASVSISSRRRDPSAYAWPHGGDPNNAWDQLKVKQIVEMVKLPDIEQPPNTLRVVCISDTHNRTDELVSLRA